MSRFIRLSFLAAASAALVACGGGAKLGGGKEGAAKALFEASQPTSKSQMSAQSLMARLASGAELGSETVKCAHGGSATLKLDLSSILGGGEDVTNFKFEVEYDDCNEDGVNEFNGTLVTEFDFTNSDTAFDFSLKLKGKLEISGEIDDFIDADVTQTIAVSVPDQTTGSVSIKLVGTIKTSEGTYTYDGTPLSISVDGEIPMADDSKS